MSSAAIRGSRKTLKRSVSADEGAPPLNSGLREPLTSAARPADVARSLVAALTVRMATAPHTTTAALMTANRLEWWPRVVRLRTSPSCPHPPAGVHIRSGCEDCGFRLPCRGALSSEGVPAWRRECSSSSKREATTTVGLWPMDLIHGDCQGLH